MQRSISARASSGAHTARGASTSTTATPSSSTASTSASAKDRHLRADPTLARSFRGHHGAVRSVAYSPVLVRAKDTQLPGYGGGVSDGTDERGATSSSRARLQKAASSFVQQLASGGEDHVVMVWHLRPALRAFRFLGHSGPINAVSFSPDGSLLASASDDHTVRVWTPSNEGKSVVLRGHMAPVRSLAWSADNMWLLSTSDDQQCKLWDVSKGVAHSHFHGHTQAVLSCAFSPDMRLVATGSADRTVKLFDLQTQRCLQTFYQNTGPVTCVKFHPFGTVLATGSEDSSIKLWDIRHNQLLQHYTAHDLAVSSIDFHPSGNYLLSTSLDSSIKLWDLRKGHQLYTIHGHPSPVYSGMFNLDGSSFVTGGGDQRVITWNCQLEAPAGSKKTTSRIDALHFPKVGHEELAKSTKRGALPLAAQVSHPLHPNTGQLSRNITEPGRRDAFYEAHGLTTGPTSTTPLSLPLPTPQPSGPLPPTDLSASQAKRSIRDRRRPPTYTFQTGEMAGQVIGPGALYVAEEEERRQQQQQQQEASASTSEEQRQGENAFHCDYQHTHLNYTTGALHSYNDRHAPGYPEKQLSIEAAIDATEEEYQEHQPLDQQLHGFSVPGMTSKTYTGIASTRAGVPGPSPPPVPSAPSPELEEGAAMASASPSPTASMRGTTSFAASAAGVGSNQVHASVSRGRAATGAAGVPGHKDEYVYSYSADKFVPASSHPSHASTALGVPLKNPTSGVDIFAIPPADHVQRLPEQLAHTLKYMVTQLDQITRALNVFEFRMNVQEQKVDRLAQQQSRWLENDGY